MKEDLQELTISSSSFSYHLKLNVMKGYLKDTHAIGLDLDILFWAAEDVAQCKHSLAQLTHTLPPEGADRGTLTLAKPGQPLHCNPPMAKTSTAANIDPQCVNFSTSSNIWLLFCVHNIFKIKKKNKNMIFTVLD